LAGAPQELTLSGKRFSPGVWNFREGIVIDNFLEILKETIPAPLTFVLSKSNRSHISFSEVYPIKSHHIAVLRCVVGLVGMITGKA
jgi:tRNA A37 threonylcarbamoyladenosine synthetase subunit TsaC/SUA5/YrdC